MSKDPSQTPRIAPKAFRAKFITVRGVPSGQSVLPDLRGIHVSSLQMIELSRSLSYVCRTALVLVPSQATALHAAGCDRFVRAATVYDIKLGKDRVVFIKDIVLSKVDDCHDGEEKEASALETKRLFVSLENVDCSLISFRDRSTCQFIQGDEGTGSGFGDRIYELFPGGLVRFQVAGAKSFSSIEFNDGEYRFLAESKAFE